MGYSHQQCSCFRSVLRWFVFSNLWGSFTSTANFFSRKYKFSNCFHWNNCKTETGQHTQRKGGEGRESFHIPERTRINLANDSKEQWIETCHLKQFTLPSDTCLPEGASIWLKGCSITSLRGENDIEKSTRHVTYMFRKLELWMEFSEPMSQVEVWVNTGTIIFLLQLQAAKLWQVAGPIFISLCCGGRALDCFVLQ